ncbi:serine carboxypeptidase-like 50 [Elaeis guineensis]|uniref:Carboxypeptidase n=1 Tax=Elaeis guineensis var. tenera TaxID=51953 RepID=A0A6I9RQE5_ELAGV|nr:serine carboxypeptidase-like 50 [Elaeis guineensis]
MEMESTLFFLLCFLPFLLLPATPTTLFPQDALPTKSGYLPINATTCNSSAALFYAYYEAQHPLSPLTHTPLLIWLQGGPGCSSMLGNLFELGPWLVATDKPTLSSNPAAWNRRFGLLFIDSPLGTGFSTAANPDDIPRDQPTIAKHLWGALQSFLSSNSSFKTRPLYLTGESYAGKYIPAAGYYILQQNSQLPMSLRINLKGVAIGNGLTHPVAQVATHAASAYFTGLINERQKGYLEELQGIAMKLTLEEKWSEASDARGHVLQRLQNMTGLATLYDVTKKKPYESDMVGVLLNKDEVKEALGVAKGVVWEECSETVGSVLHEDVMKSVKFMLEELVRKSRVLLYQGIYDLRDGVVSTEAWMKEMEWDGLENFLKAERKVWKVNGELAGYVQRWGSLSHVVVSGAGHLVPADQGQSSQAMIENWVLEKGLFSEARKEAPGLRRAY